MESLVEIQFLQQLASIPTRAFALSRDQIRKELRDYARTVAAVEWPQMQARRLSFESSPPLDDLYYTYLAIEPQTEKEISAFQYSLQMLDVVRNNRGNRIRLSFGALSVARKTGPGSI